MSEPVDKTEGSGALPEETVVRLVRLRAADGVMLDGALWLPEQAGQVGVVHLHGKGGNFYSGPSRFIPGRSASGAVVHLSLNMACHDLGYTRYDEVSPDFADGDVPVAGGFWEELSRGYQDVAAAVGYLRSAGVERVVVCGHSSGGWYAVDYARRDPKLAGLVLLSPLTGNRTALPRWFPEKGQLDAALSQAQRLVDEGRGVELIALHSWYYAISARSLLERAVSSDTEWEEALASLEMPALLVWGDDESRHDLWRRIAERNTRPGFSWLSLPGCEHHFIGHEDRVAAEVLAFAESVSMTPVRTNLTGEGTGRSQ